MYEVVQQQNFGLGDKDFVQIGSGTGPVYAVEIDPSSEIDACWLSHSDLTVQGGLMGGQQQAPGYFGSDLQGLISQYPPAASSLLCQEHPAIGPLKGVITVLPFYSYKKSTSSNFINSKSMHGVGKLALRVWREPPPFAIGTTGRGVLHGGWFRAPAAGLLRVIPTFGRRLMRVWARAAVAANLFVDYGWTQNGVCAFGTANALAAPGAPQLMNFKTYSVPHWITVYDDGVHKVDDVLVEVFG